MRVDRFAPTDLLQSAIDYIWLMQSDFPNEDKREDIIMPLGHSNIIFNFASSYTLVEADKETMLPNAAVVGQIKEAKTVRYGQTLEQIGISLKPAGVLSLFKTPGIAIAGRIVDVSDFDATLNDLYIELKGLRDVEQKIKRIYEYMECKIKPDKNSLRLSEMVAYVISQCENFNIQKMAEYFSVSVSALERFFKKYAGLTPKIYCEIIKFRKNVEDAELRKSIQDYYYDQSHLIKNTKKFTAKTFLELEEVKDELTLYHLLNSKEP